MQRALIFTLLSLLGIGGSIGLLNKMTSHAGKALSQITFTPEAAAGGGLTLDEDYKIAAKSADLASKAIVPLIGRGKGGKRLNIDTAVTPERSFHLPDDFEERNKTKSRLTVREALEQHYR